MSCLFTVFIILWDSDRLPAIVTDSQRYTAVQRWCFAPGCVSTTFRPPDITASLLWIVLGRGIIAGAVWSVKFSFVGGFLLETPIDPLLATSRSGSVGDETSSFRQRSVSVSLSSHLQTLEMQLLRAFRQVRYSVHPTGVSYWRTRKRLNHLIVGWAIPASGSERDQPI